MMKTAIGMLETTAAAVAMPAVIPLAAFLLAVIPLVLVELVGPLQVVAALAVGRG